jgi:hypothetical protein
MNKLKKVEWFFHWNCFEMYVSLFFMAPAGVYV